MNEKINIDRKWLNKFRGELYRFTKFEMPMDNDFKHGMYARLKGKFAFLSMVNPEKAEKYRGYFNLIEPKK